MLHTLILYTAALEIKTVRKFYSQVWQKVITQCDNCYELWQESVTSPMVECTSFCNLFSFLRSCGIFIKTRCIRISKLQKYVERAIINNKCRVLNLKSDSHLPKSFIFILFQGKPFKNDEKCFLFRLKSSFRSQDI